MATHFGILPGKPHGQRSLVGYSAGQGLQRVGHDLATKHGEGNGNPLQYSCLENPVNGGGW